MRKLPRFKETNIEAVFNDLKLKGLIKKDRILVASKCESGLRAKGKEIIYNPLFSDFNKDNLKYLLLHEEAHLTHFQHSSWIIILVFILAFGAYYHSKNIWIAFAGLILPLFIFRRFITKDELAADLWSAEQLKLNFKITKPSKIMESTYKEFKLHRKERNFISKTCTMLIRLFCYHPPFDKRIEYVRVRVE